MKKRQKQKKEDIVPIAAIVAWLYPQQGIALQLNNTAFDEWQQPSRGKTE